MDKKTYNGLENDLVLFAKFVLIYESIMGSNPKLSKLGEIIGHAINCFDLKIKKYVQRTDIKNIEQGIDFTSCTSNKTLFLTCYSSLFVDVCRHLRNSFCHSLLTKNKDIIFIRDFYKHKRMYSSNGYLPYNDLKEFISILIEDYEHKK